MTASTGDDSTFASTGPSVAIVGAGPAGLIAAQVLAEAGCRVSLYERMASPARKFLIAGRGGLNLTHSEPRESFLARYGAARDWLAPMLDVYPPARLRALAERLGEATFIGTSGRVFPKSFKASPLLRTWLGRLGELGVTLETRHDWRGWTPEGALRFSTPQGEHVVAADAAIFALGGASWPRLGGDGSWVAPFREAGVSVAPLRPSNSGARIVWSDFFRARHAGQPLKRIALTAGGVRARGEAMITEAGLEGGAVYELSARLREEAEWDGAARLTVDLRPDLGEAELVARLAATRKGESMANRLRKAAALSPAAASLLREAGLDLPSEPKALAMRIKAVPLAVEGLAGLERAISSAGGVARSALGPDLMLTARSGQFIAGEMLDWEAPTGGYLLQGCFATGYAAACGALRHLGLAEPTPWTGPWHAGDAD
ncbi:TIGR03862 family flavoprotein [Ancylobacter sp. A5.8]|uniref:NAD(P)/FAD-dependent oxidoreductase n=1 Tax=Ancylobacter gelatini TaxID=2919920 RepID=UPI001F4F0641|nr:TIGR03862 family flavoprotein [Ancylobacter gelatini]